MYVKCVSHGPRKKKANGGGMNSTDMILILQ